MTTTTTVSPAQLGHDLRVSLCAEIAALHVFKRDAEARRDVAALATLELREAGCWDALGNAQQLRARRAPTEEAPGPGGRAITGRAEPAVSGGDQR